MVKYGERFSMIKTTVAKYIDAVIEKSNQTALQADGLTFLNIVGETHINLTRGTKSLKLEALVVNELDVDILAGIPFMSANDIAIHPARQEIIIDESFKINYGPLSDQSSANRIRRTQAYVLRSKACSTVVWPGYYIKLDLPSDLDPDGTIAIESCTDSPKSSASWPKPSILEAVDGKIRIVNDTPDPQTLRRHEHFCQVHTTTDMTASNPVENIPVLKQNTTPSTCHSEVVKVDPDNMLTDADRSKFQNLNREFDYVFCSQLPGYNGAFGKFEATINMDPAQPPQRKGRIPQYSRDKLLELQQKFDQLEQLGVFCWYW